MVKPIVKGVRHVALYAPNPDVLAEFFETVLGLQIVARSNRSTEAIRGSVYLNCESEETSYQLSIVANPDIRHTAFEVDSLADLKTFYALIVEYGLRIRWMLNHGVSLAFYFHDPADNLIKLYWSTGIDYPQPHGHPIDLTQSEAALRQDVANMVAKLNAARGE
jgi:catechol-2,3-dioxygenase